MKHYENASKYLLEYGQNLGVAGMTAFTTFPLYI
jgi:hypothetical protein